MRQGRRRSGCPSGQAAYNSVFVWVSLGSAHAAAWSKMTTFTGLCGMGANHGRVPAGTQRLRAGVRAGTRAMTRVLLNAMIYGPGFGADQPIRP